MTALDIFGTFQQFCEPWWNLDTLYTCQRNIQCNQTANDANLCLPNSVLTTINKLLQFGLARVGSR
jgi:flagellar motor switch protein FliM